MHAELAIDPNVRAVAPARRWARARMVEAGLDDAELEVLVLLVSETVTNAVLHAHPPVVLHIDVDDERTRIEVHDGRRGAPVLRDPPSTSTNGRGVLVVDRLATRWGTELTPGTHLTEPLRAHSIKSVWFELDRALTSEPA